MYIIQINKDGGITMNNDSRKSTNDCLEQAKATIVHLLENHASHATIVIHRSCLSPLQAEFPNILFFSEEISSLDEIPDEYKDYGPQLKCFSNMLASILCSTDDEIVVSVTFPEN